MGRLICTEKDFAPQMPDNKPIVVEDILYLTILGPGDGVPL